VVGSGLVCQPPRHAGRPVHRLRGVARDRRCRQFGELFDLPANLRISPLARRFGWSPASVLHAAGGRWRARKRQWIEQLGIESEQGRGENLQGLSKTALAQGGGGTSVFDPVLCELAYQSWCPELRVILDSFAGGSVRGIVAGALGLTYTGIELWSAQVAANRRQARRLPRRELRRPPTWIEGDARQELPRLAEAGRRFDMVFTCPPYFDLERYSDNPADLSAMEPGGFEAALREVIAGSAALLDEDRFAVWVVGAVRDRATGTLRDLASIVFDAHRKAGLAHYNDAILETAR
jgi:hypothetical protein